MGKSPPPFEKPGPPAGLRAPLADADDEPTALNAAEKDGEEDGESTLAAPAADADEMTLPLPPPAKRVGPARQAFGEEDEDGESSRAQVTVRPHPWRADRMGNSLHRPASPAGPTEPPPQAGEAPSERALKGAPGASRGGARAGRPADPAPVAVREATRRDKPPREPAKFPSPPKPPRPRSGILGLLDDAQEPGVLYRAGDAALPVELAVAVERALEQLAAVRGVGTVSAGRNELAEPVVVIQAAHGFSEGSLRDVPATVDGFPTLVIIPYELLPLKRAP